MCKPDNCKVQKAIHIDIDIVYIDREMDYKLHLYTHTYI